MLKRDKTPKNSRCRLCGDRDETINHIINECSKLAPWDFEIQMDHLISARRPDLVIVNKK